jgi:hypothetical protein
LERVGLRVQLQAITVATEHEAEQQVLVQLDLLRFYLLQVAVLVLASQQLAAIALLVEDQGLGARPVSR